MAFNHEFPPYATWVVDAKGTAVREIVGADPGERRRLGRGQYGHYADVSPDGSRIVYSTCEYTYFDHDKGRRRYNRGYEIAAVNVDGSDQQRLTENVHFENYPVWSPDGNRIAFIAHNDGRRWAAIFQKPSHYETYNSEIFTRAADGTDERVVPNTKGVGLYPPVWSPDGQRLAFTAHEVSAPASGRSEPQERILYTVRLDGSEPSRIGEATTLPTWSPDGERLAFGLDDGVYTVRYGGTDLSELLDDFRANEVSWSPDGSEILLASDSGVYVVRPDGSGLRSVGPPVRTTEATWSPDGSMIAARHERDPEGTTWNPSIFVIFTMDRDGTDVRFLARGFLEGDGRTTLKIVPVAVAPIDPETCSNGVAVAQPQVTPGLVQDCKVLIGLRDAFGSLATSGWTTVRNIAEWPGVTVSGDPPRVRELTLWSNHVMGTIPPETAKLEMLEKLNLFSNSLLVGPIPPELGNLAFLTTLSLSDNNLSGLIPPELGNLTTLRVLGLSHNNLSGTIPPELGNLGMLWVLSLSNGNLSGSIPPELGNLTMLRALFLENNNLSGPIPAELGNLTSLERMRTNLTNNALTGCVPIELPDLWVEVSGLPRCKP